MALRDQNGNLNYPPFIYYVRKEWASDLLYINSKEYTLYRVYELLTNPSQALKYMISLKDNRLGSSKPFEEMDAKDFLDFLNEHENFLKLDWNQRRKDYKDLDNLRIALAKWLNTES